MRLLARNQPTKENTMNPTTLSAFILAYCSLSAADRAACDVSVKHAAKESDRAAKKAAKVVLIDAAHLAALHTAFDRCGVETLAKNAIVAIACSVLGIPAESVTRHKEVAETLSNAKDFFRCEGKPIVQVTRIRKPESASVPSSVKAKRAA